ncbi:MAG TPA: ATP-dependent DNA ligase [Methylomirabilota bacterium]|nr:ATP-dependent DNA ligase [Methylomirabilota bacterium]
MEVRYHRGGVHLPEFNLWLDSHLPQQGPERVFVSHAHSDHIAPHREIICSEPTSRLMHARIEGNWIEHKLPFLQSCDFSAENPYRITLLPAGHIFGSAMSLVEGKGSSLLYTGDFKLRTGLSAEKCEPREADILIMETTYGRPEYRFPPTEAVVSGIVRFCREALDNEETPVLLGYSLGKSQEILCSLGEAGLPIMLHGTVHRLTKIYEQFGHCFPAYEKYEAGNARGKVLLCPPNVSNSAMLRNLGKVRLAVLTGWAVDPNCRFRYQAHAAFPISDHADFTDLVSFVHQVKPKKVYTLHGFAADFARTLRDLGYDALALSEEEQLALPLLVPGRVASAIVEPAPRPPLKGSPDGPLFREFSLTCAAISKTTKKLEKVRLLTEYLKPLDSAPLRAVSVWFTGQPFPSTENKVLSLGWAIIRDALCSMGKLDQAQFGQVYLKHSDLGETAQEIFTNLGATDGTLTIEQVQDTFERLYHARGPLAKLPMLMELLRSCDPLEAKYVVKILTSDLRIGLKEGLVEDAIASAFGVPLDEVKNTNLLVGNIGETALLAKRGQLSGVTIIPFRPIKYMLASPEETAADIWNRVLEWQTGSKRKGAQPPLLTEPTSVWLEDKYDGIRAQIHKVGNVVAIYSRDLKAITETFHDIAERARKVEHDFMLDGEIVAMRGEQILPFADLQRRLGRRESDLFLGEEVPVVFVAFDCLWLDNQNQLDLPLKQRREALTKLNAFRLSTITEARSADEIEEAFTAARNRGNEGLLIKDPNSVYTPGRRGLSWLKLKKAFATLDCVVVGAEYGHGKRKGVLSDYTFAVRDEATGELKTIGKAYSGLTDIEIAQLTRHFLSRTIRQHGRYHEVKPDTVLEIAFDLLQPSDRHTSGLAMRFPRIVRIRTDKSPAEIDTVQAARALAQRRASEETT